jgi:hypothetical protein
VNLLAIDPGAETCACVSFGHDVIYRAEFAMFVSGPYDDVVVERMQADKRTRDVDVRHILACQFNGALCAGFAAGVAWCSVSWATPHEWKGTEPKPAQHARLWMIMSDAERAIFGGDKTAAVIERAVEKGALNRWGKPGADYYPRKWVTHNLLDAAALGCVHIGRLEKR